MEGERLVDDPAFEISRVVASDWYVLAFARHLSMGGVDKWES